MGPLNGSFLSAYRAEGFAVCKFFSAIAASHENITAFLRSRAAPVIYLIVRDTHSKINHFDKIKAFLLKNKYKPTRRKKAVLPLSGEQPFIFSGVRYMFLSRCSIASIIDSAEPMLSLSSISSRAVERWFCISCLIWDISENLLSASMK